ncbi:MAG: DUF87 domain-containing protein [Clostridia bacterium]|nr:DUF87 domain-containing protein [Clostridia bacterium]
MRVIPKTAKVQVKFFRNISVADILIALIGIVLAVVICLSNIGIARFFIAAIVVLFVAGLYIPYDGQRFYLFFRTFVRYLFSGKRYVKQKTESASNIKSLVAFKNVRDGYIEFGDYYGGVLEIGSREFRLLTGFRQDQIINNYFGKVIREISGKTRASLIKIDRKIRFDDFIATEEAKRDDLKKTFDAGELTEQELFVRERVIQDRIAVYNNLNASGDDKIMVPGFYLVVYDAQKSVIDEILTNAVETFAEAGMNSHILDTKELCVFLKYNFTDKFNEEDIDVMDEREYMDWILPDELTFSSRSTKIDGEESFCFTIRNYPLAVGNAWGFQLFNTEDTKIVMNLEPFEKEKAVKMIDRSLQELLSQSDQSFRASSIIDRQTHINTLVQLLALLKNDNENLYKVNIHIQLYNRSKDSKKNLKKRLLRVLSEQGFELSDDFCNQNRALISMNPSENDVMAEFQRSIHSNSIAAVFPFVLSSIMEKGGVTIGQSKGFPVIVDFFARNDERVNSNMVIMGKSGSGKSYSTKTLLTHLATENCKIFILDPENEYDIIASNLGGKLIDVGTASHGRLNPFHVITTLDADEDTEGASSAFSVHLQFLEQFFREILPGIDAHALEMLNNMTVELYRRKGITEDSDFSALTAEDYPIFDDLYNYILEELEKATVAYDVENLRVLKNFISKFASGGRNAKLWNGPSTLSVKENFAVFNFQSLLANKNGVIANAQMLLVLKWLDNEIIKNRDFNLKYNTNRKIVVAIDEAYVFIDPKYPIALDFMYQLAKRIRKYNGMQIIITQNIKDFVGSQDIIRKSTAIINACQYSFIFALAPNDMDDLCTLYSKAGNINKAEQDQIINNARGSAFIITGPQSRTSIDIIASQRVASLFQDKKA